MVEMAVGNVSEVGGIRAGSYQHFQIELYAPALIYLLLPMPKYHKPQETNETRGHNNRRHLLELASVDWTGGGGWRGELVGSFHHVPRLCNWANYNYCANVCH